MVDTRIAGHVIGVLGTLPLVCRRFLDSDLASDRRSMCLG